MSVKKMHAIGERQADFSYFGDRPEWLVVLGQHRDSEALDRSNFIVVKEDLQETAKTIGKRWHAKASFADDHVAVESCGHWAVGWVEYLLVNPACKPLVEAANEWRKQLDDYPVASDDHYYELMYDEQDHIVIDEDGTIIEEESDLKTILPSMVLERVKIADVPNNAHCCVCCDTGLEMQPGYPQGMDDEYPYAYIVGFKGERSKYESWCCGTHVTDKLLQRQREEAEFMREHQPPLPFTEAS